MRPIRPRCGILSPSLSPMTTGSWSSTGSTSDRSGRRGPSRPSTSRRRSAGSETARPPGVHGC
eukprot:13210195-Alexandrium_andersonii.AAC.1